MASNATKTISMQNKYDRIVVLVDMDCFYCQVEEKLNPTLKGQPVAVVQYKTNSGIIAVNYEARAKGVTRHMREDQAKQQCPKIQLVRVPNIREKADLRKYREAGKEVADVLQQFTTILERASVDEAYLDITESVNKRLNEMHAGAFVLQPDKLVNTYAVGYDNIGDYVTLIASRLTDPYADDDELQLLFSELDLPSVRTSDIRLLIGASIAGEIRATVKDVTGYECSAGIAHNKILAKLACGLNKPNKQTILPLKEISKFFETLPVAKIKGLGAKFGEEVCVRLNIKFLGQLMKFTEAELQKKFDEKNGTWLYNICRGIDLEAVTQRFYSKSIGCSKNFPGKSCIKGVKTLQHWLQELSIEISERLEKDVLEFCRRAKQMTVSFTQEIDGEDIAISRSIPLIDYEHEMLAKRCFDVIKSNTKQFFRTGDADGNTLNNPIKHLGISVGKFETTTIGKNNLKQLFAKQTEQQQAKQAQNVDVSIKNERQKTGTENNENVESEETQKNNRRNDDNLVKYSNEKNAKNKSTIVNFFQNSNKTENTKKSNENQTIETKSLENETEFYENSAGSTENSNKVVSNVTKSVNQPDRHETSLKETNNNDENKIKPNIAGIDNGAVLDVDDGSSNSFFLKYMKEQQQQQQQQQQQEQLEKEKNSTLPNGKNFGIRNFAQITTIKENKSLPQTSTSSNNGINIRKRKMNDDDGDSNDIDINDDIERTISINSKKQTTNFESTYAEFSLPEIRPEILDTIKCEICNVKILNAEKSIQSHKDYHMALELSQQQRLEYRAELKKKINTKSATSSSVKSSTPVASKKPTAGRLQIPAITNFLPTKATVACEAATIDTSLPTLPPLEPSTSAAAQPFPIELEICEICKERVNKTKMLEHQDFHYAKDLEKSFVTQTKSKPPAASKMKNGKSKNPLVKPITAFFQQQNTQ